MVSAMQNRTYVGALAAAVLTVVVTGCGGTADATKPQIATLRSADAPAASTAAAQERPVIRADATADDINALEQAYFGCLAAAGVPMSKSENGEYGKPKWAGSTDKRWGPASEACAAKEPESWYDREQRVNPEFADRLRDAVKCLKDRGFKARLEGDPPKIRYSDTAEFMRAGDAESECQRKAFSARIKELY